MPENDRATQDLLLGLTAEIVSAHVSANKVGAADLPPLIASVYEALRETGAAPAPPQEPAVPINKSVTRYYLVCLEDGRKLKLLRPYLMRTYGMTPDEYRQKWGLRSDYPMVAADYTKRRSELAKAIGLGQRGRSKRAAAKRGTKDEG